MSTATLGTNGALLCIAIAYGCTDPIEPSTRFPDRAERAAKIWVPSRPGTAETDRGSDSADEARPPMSSPAPNEPLESKQPARRPEPPALVDPPRAAPKMPRARPAQPGQPVDRCGRPLVA